MANRYWVGGTGTWDSSNTTHWSASSGGTAGASAPTYLDDVYFNSSSGGGTCSLVFGNPAACRNINFTGWTGTLNRVYYLRIYGSFVAGTTATFTGDTIYNGFFCDTSTVGATFDGSGRNVGIVYFSPQQNGTMSLSSHLIANYIFFGPYGTASWTSTFNSNNYNITAYGLTSDPTNYGINIDAQSGYSAAKTTINFGTSTITTTTFNIIDYGTMTFNTANAKYVLSNKLQHQGGGAYHNMANVTFSDGHNTYPIQGPYPPTFRALNFAAGSTTFNVSANLVINTAFTATGTSTASPKSIKSDSAGTRRKITAGSTSLTNISWQDIEAAGTASPFTGTGFANNGNNLYITFIVPTNGFLFGSSF